MISRQLPDRDNSAEQKGQRWKFQIYAPKDPEKPELGETRVTRGGFRNLEEAQAALADALKKKAQNEKYQGTVPTIAAYANHWASGLRVEASTIAGYRKIIRNHITPALGDIHVDKLTATRIAAHYRELEKSGRSDQRAYGAPLSANTVHKVHVTLGAILDAALDDDLFPLWRTIAYTGMRRGEALALRWGDINVQTQRISIRRAADVTERNKAEITKTGTARVIDIDAETLRVLKAHKAARGTVSLDLARADAYVFGNDEGEIRVPDAITDRWSRRLTWATAKIDGLTRVTLKGLRHTHATLLLELGEHPKVVQERLGHSTINTTMNIYSHVTPTMQKAAIDRFAEHLREP